ncbi:MAG: hypothetical protein H6836_05280 [Planctomycetes bacterium]|nr:hypothetical protein [Planctomycetota bacterium]
MNRWRALLAVEGAASPAFLAVVAALGLSWRLLVSSWTVLPREDGVTYLWMAERFAAGDVSAALGQVFPPLTSLLIAVPVAFGVEPFAAGQLVLAVCGAAAIVPTARLAQRLVPGGGRAAALLAAVATRPVMLGAQVYSEPLFALLAALALERGLAGRMWTASVASGLAFWVRPEAALVPVALLVSERGAWRAFVGLGAGVGALSLWRGMCDVGFDPVPKLAFIRAHNVATSSPLGHVLELPGCWLEAFGVLGLLAILGMLRVRPRSILVLFGLVLAMLCLYVPRWRFLAGWTFAVVPLAVAGLRLLPARPWLFALVVGSQLVVHGGVRADRVAERELALHLRGLLRPGERITGDMTRVLYFAGVQPLEPRHYTAAELCAMGRQARFVVLRERRATTPGVVEGLPRHGTAVLPEGLAERVRERGILVLERR